jgi:uncharacterized protein YggU (UPF0235/DUF167 family)
VDGRANDELVEALARVLGIAKRQVTIARGEKSTHKTVRIEGLTAKEVRRRLGLEAPQAPAIAGEPVPRGEPEGHS